MIKAKSILLSAEDDSDDRLFIQEAVKKIPLSLHLEFVKDGKDLLDYLEKTKTDSDAIPSLILLDLQLPGVNGREALRLIREEDSFKNLPVVVLTGFANEEDRQICKELGALGVFPKPSSFVGMVDVLKSIFSEWLPLEAA